MTSELLAAVAAAFDGARLRQARELSGLKRHELAALADISPAAIGQFESAVTRPRSSTVAVLSEVLDVLPSFFVAGRSMPELPPGGAHFRSLRRTRAVERQRALAYVQLVCEAAEQLTRFVELPPVSLGLCSDLPVHESPRAMAALLRQCWSLDDGPVPHLVRQMEARGVLVAWPRFDGSGDVDAFSTVARGRPVVVLTGDRDDVFRFRFAAAHELGHLLLHRNPAPGDRRHEDEADEFATHLLMPSEQLAQQLPTALDLRRLMRLCDFWGVSVEALLMRSMELDVLPPQTVRRGFRMLTRLRATGALVPAPILQFAGEVPSLFQRVLSVAEEAGFDFDVLASSMGLPTKRTRSILGLEARARLRLVVS